MLDKPSPRAGRLFPGSTEIPPADLEKKLSSNARIQKEKELYLHADRSLPYGQVVEIMAVARPPGGESLGMITQPDRGVRGAPSAAPPPAPPPPPPPRPPRPRAGSPPRPTPARAP